MSCQSKSGRDTHHAIRITPPVLVADADLVAYFWIEQTRSAAARRVRRRDAAWVVPPLWREAFWSILREHLRTGLMTQEEALRFAEQAEADLRPGAEHDVETAAVLRLIDETECSARDAAYVALAQALGVPLVTGDRALTRQFPETAVVMEDVAEGA